MKVLHIIASANPDEGGPIAYALNMAQERQKEQDESLFITADPIDAPYVEAFPFQIVTTKRTATAFGRAIENNAPGCDVAIIHGLWNAGSIGGFHTLKKLGIPWFIFPHGMLDPYFKTIKPAKHIAKQIYWSLWQGRVLSQSAQVLFTSEEEQRLAKAAFYGHQSYSSTVLEYCAADQFQEHPSKPSKITGTRPYFLYLSRIHQKKGLDLLLKAFAKYSKQYDNYDLVIAGPDKNNVYADTLKAQANALGLKDRVLWYGAASGEDKKALFKHAEAFILPSHQENFGQVVAEALSAGLPVLISDKINIWREIEASGAGLVFEDTLDGTEKLLSTYLELPSKEREALRSKSRDCYEKKFSVSSAYHALKSQLEGAIIVKGENK